MRDSTITAKTRWQTMPATAVTRETSRPLKLLHADVFLPHEITRVDWP